MTDSTKQLPTYRDKRTAGFAAGEVPLKLPSAPIGSKSYPSLF
jgi:hypothetical protein